MFSSFSANFINIDGKKQKSLFFMAERSEAATASVAECALTFNEP